MQTRFDTSDSYVNTLTVADFNLFSRAIQGDSGGLVKDDNTGNG